VAAVSGLSAEWVRRRKDRLVWGIAYVVVAAVVTMPMGVAAQSGDGQGADGSPEESQSDRPTIQNRFAEKRGDLYGHVTGMTQIRNDYYDSFGLGLDVGYFPWESVGFEMRGFWVRSALNPAAQEIREETGLTPDARPQEWMTTAGVRYSFGYGKMKIGQNSLVHFDPQLALHGGVAFADGRVLPTLTTAGALLLHFEYGIQAKLDIGMAVQMEDRARGWVPSIGFAPVIGIGGSIPASTIGSLFSGESSSGDDAQNRTSGGEAP